MDKTKFSVNDILDELQILKAKEEMHNPQSDMKRVDELVESLLVEKKTAELQKEKEAMSRLELESFEKEIKSQTKSITRQYEKLVKEQTKRLKRSLRDEKAALHELKIDDGNEADEQSLTNTQALRLASIAAEQKVKIQNTAPIENAADQRKERLSSIMHSAHVEHIKREKDNITAHFGNVKMSDESVETGYARAEITPSIYKEFKKNRNKKIDGFELETPQTAPIAPPELELPPQAPQPPVPSPAAQEHEVVREPLHSVQENKDFGLDLYEHEYESEAQADDIREHLKSKKRMTLVSLIAIAVLAINSAILAAVGLSDTGALMLFGKVAVSTFSYAMLNMVLLLLCIAFGIGAYIDAIKGVARREADKNILYLAVTLIVAIANIMLLLNHEKLLSAGVHIYTPILIISMLFNYIGRYQIASHTLDNFEFLASGKQKFAVSFVNSDTARDMAKGLIDDEPIMAKRVETDFCAEFLTKSFCKDQSDVFGTRVAFVAFPLALVLAMVSFLLKGDAYVMLTVFSGVLTLSASFIGALLVAFPLHDTSSITRHFAGTSLTVGAIEDFKDANMLLLDAYDLFPEGSIVLYGIKTFSGKRIDEAIIDAASVVCKSRSMLSGIFMGIINNNAALLRKVDSIAYEDLMGLSAWVADRRVLIGNRELMIHHSVAVPKREYEDKYHAQGQELIYISTEGELCAAFVVQLAVQKNIANVIKVVQGNDIKCVVKTTDSLLSSELLARAFNVEQDMFKVLPSRLHKAYEQETVASERAKSSIATNSRLLGYIMSVVSAKKLSYCIKTGSILHALSIILGIGMFAVMMFAGRLSVFSPLFMLVFMLIFTVIYWIHQKNIRL